MPETLYCFTITYSRSEPRLSAASGGISLTSSEEVCQLAEVCGLKAVVASHVTRIDVELPEGSTALERLLGLIHQKYGFFLCRNRVVPMSMRSNTFGVIKRRAYSDHEIDESGLLYIAYVDGIIGNF